MIRKFKIMSGNRLCITSARLRSFEVLARALSITAALIWLPESTVRAQSVEGFAEPVQTVDVASPESGTVQEIRVRQGQKVRKGDVLVQMDPDALLPALELAKAKAEARAKMEAAKIELQVKQRRLDNLNRLGKENSSSEEVVRATADVDLAKTSVMAAEEEIRQSQLEAKRIEVQLERRTIRSPINGVVLKLHHDPGEFVTISAPTLVTVADLSQLRIVLHPMSADASSLEEKARVQVQLERQNELADAIVDFVSPVTNADSGTIRIELLVDNPTNRFRSGQRCWLLPTVPLKATTKGSDRLGSAGDVPLPSDIQRQ